MKYHPSYRRALIASLVAAALAPVQVYAAGFALIEANARGQGNAYAGAAAYTPDASTIFFNPAGMMSFEGDSLVAAGHLIMADSKFNNDGSTAAAGFAGTPFASLNGDGDDGGATAVVPNVYWVKKINDSSKFGVGFNAPFGTATKYDDDWVGRYHGIVSDLQILNVNPSYAYQVSDGVSVGVGLNMMIGHVNLTNALDFGAICMANFTPTYCQQEGMLPQQADGFADLEADNFDDISTGFNLGLTVHPNENATFGVAYRSEVDMKMQGEADFKVPVGAEFVYAAGLFLDSDIEAEVTLPASLSLSYAHQVDRITYLFDVTLTGWSSFEELRIEYDNSGQPDSVTTEEWEDSTRVSFGIDYQYNEETVYRVGIAYDETPIPSAERRTPRLPGNDRTWLSFGVSKDMGEGMSIDVGYSHLFLDDAEVNNEFESSVPTLAATLQGEYESEINIFSVQLNWQY